MEEVQEGDGSGGAVPEARRCWAEVHTDGPRLRLCSQGPDGGGEAGPVPGPLPPHVLTLDFDLGTARRVTLPRFEEHRAAVLVEEAWEERQPPYTFSIDFETGGTRRGG